MIKKNCYIIAEIGVNHNNSISIAKKLILSAKNCGADAVFQTFNAERLKYQPHQKLNTKEIRRKKNHI